MCASCVQRTKDKEHALVSNERVWVGAESALGNANVSPQVDSIPWVNRSWDFLLQCHNHWQGYLVSAWPLQLHDDSRDCTMSVNFATPRGQDPRQARVYIWVQNLIRVYLKDLCTDHGHFRVKYFNFEFTQERQTDLQSLDIFYSDAILLDRDNPLISQESRTGALLPLRSLSGMYLDCTSSHPELLPSKHIMIP